jgi:CRISPR-associated endoribonuclease Cas6
LHDADMPIVIDLRLKASWQVRPDTRQLHGLACALFETEDSEHFGHDKPFSVWPVTPTPGGAAPDWQWRAAWLPAELPPVASLAADQLRLGHVTCQVTEVRHRSVPHAQLAAERPVQAVTVEFRSPTYFSQNGFDVVLPDPRLMVGSWRRRWNASLPEGHALVIDEDAWRQSHRAIRLAEFDLRTERRDSGRGHERAGFIGSVTLRVDKDGPATARAVLGTLARFAEFCGTGAQTTHGFGATAVSAGLLGGGDGGVAGPRVH